MKLDRTDIKFINFFYGNTPNLIDIIFIPKSEKDRRLEIKEIYQINILSKYNLLIKSLTKTYKIELKRYKNIEVRENEKNNI